MPDNEPKLARIESTTLGFEDHGILSSYVMLEYGRPGEKMGGSGQGFGGYILGGPGMAIWVKGVLDAVGVSDWSSLKGKMVWAVGTDSRVESITGINTGIEFNPQQEFDKLKEEGN